MSLSENDRNRRDVSTLFNDRDIEFDDIKLTNLNSITINRNPPLMKKSPVKNILMRI